MRLLLVLLFSSGLAACTGAGNELLDVSGEAGEVRSGQDSGAAADQRTPDDGPREPDDFQAAPDLSSVEVEEDAAPSCLVPAPEGPLQVATANALYQGRTDGEGVEAFVGIRYARPPVGELRWQPPQPQECAETLVDATTFGSFCPQVDLQSGEPKGDEDCLTLNVWRPEGSGAKPLPVLFFVHGGGHVQGASSQTMAAGGLLYTGQHLVEEQQVMVVTVNYRLGALGFLALPELSEESTEGVSGNYGVLDVILALQWVQENIAAFGGDPDRVMLFGESAGSVSVCTLLVSPLAQGLFHAALMQSGLCSHFPLALAQGEYDVWVAEQTDCAPGPERLACLRALGPDEILAALPGVVGAAALKFGFHPESYGPLQDGWLLPTSAAERVATGQHNDVPVVLGSNAEEYATLLTIPVTANSYQTLVENWLGLLGDEVVQAVFETYPLEAYDTPRDALIDLLGDAVFHCPARRTARLLVNHQDAPVYRYVFSRHAVTKQGFQPAGHAMELLYVFGSLFDIPFFTPHEDDAALAHEMMGYWSRFAASGDPNGTGAAKWPEYDQLTDPYLILDAPSGAAKGYHAEACDLWDSMFE